MPATQTTHSGNRKSTQKNATHERIVSSARSLIRRDGLGAATVDRVMKGAGLTVGGFYAHFPSREAMDEEVLGRALSDAARAFFRDPEDPVGSGVKRYLSPKHRDNTAAGCPLPAVLSDLTRAPRGTRRALVESMEIFVQEFAKCRPLLSAEEAREQALATFALCVGGLALGKALRGDPLSDAMLSACTQVALRQA